MLESVIAALFPILGLLGTLLLGWLTHQVVQRMKSGAARDSALELVTVAGVVARSLESTVKPLMIDASRDGRLSAADGRILMDAGVSQLRDQLSNQTLKLIASNSARVEDVLERSIEAQVHAIKTAPKKETL